MQADTTNYFVVWWVLFEYSSFDHFPEVSTYKSKRHNHFVQVTKQYHKKVLLNSFYWEGIPCGSVPSADSKLLKHHMLHIKQYHVVLNTCGYLKCRVTYRFQTTE